MSPKSATFSAVAKAAFREQLVESEWGKSEWTGKSNVAWSVIHLNEDLVGYLIVQRTHGARITGELAFSRGIHNPGLFGPIQQKKEPFGARIRIGHLMGKGDLWWPCSQDTDLLAKEVSQLVDLLIRHSEKFFRTCTTHVREQLGA